jgi:hypothetical protein
VGRMMDSLMVVVGLEKKGVEMEIEQ